MQLHLDWASRFTKDAYDYGARSSGEAHGVVLTKPHIVELILDLAGYTADRDLSRVSLLEPSVGHGAFLIPALERLLVAAKREGRLDLSLKGALTAFDIEPEHVASTRRALVEILERDPLRRAVADELVQSWVQEGDFLLAPLDRGFDVVVGNPPYVRTEQLNPALHAEYRRRYPSLYDRADLYVAFIERGLSLLSPTGVLSFICADRWISNRYGAPLRELIAKRHRVACYVDLHEASPFESEVIAYPSIFVLGQGVSESVPVVTLKTASPEECSPIATAVRQRDPSLLSDGVEMAIYPAWFAHDEPWVLSSPAHLALLRALEARLSPLETTARVGIGVATGHDKLYIVGPEADIEQGRLVPLVMRDDLVDGRVVDGQRFVINTFEDEGGVIDLADYPRLHRYLIANAPEIKRRHVAQKNPSAWFRTIDRVYPRLAQAPKLLIPDIAGSNEVVFEPGRYHPHHNLYFITSDTWDLEVLGGLVSSKVALFFVWSYAVKMRGGYLRFQAQYLRRIRLPDPARLSRGLTRALKRAFRARDFDELDRLALGAYGLTELLPFDFVDTRRLTKKSRRAGE